MLYRLLIWSVVFFWGISFVATRIVVLSIPPITAAFVRFLIASVALILVTKKMPKLLNWHSFFAGFWGVTMYFIFENSGLVYTYPTNASLIVSSAPILYTLFSHLIQKKKTSVIEYLASLVAFFGVAVVIMNGRFVLKVSLMGDLMLLGAAFAWVFYTYHVEKMTDSDSLTGVTNITLWGVLTLFPFVIFEKKPPITLTVPVIISLLYLGIVCSGVAYVFWNIGIRRVGARYTTNTIYFIPVITSIAEAILLKNLPNFYTILGGGLVILGLWLFNRQERRRNNESLSSGKDEST
ncbi:DMT family transporter [Thermotoga profunda]|uniref:DMT family transporter n=1 Tax=Thermotoga profunda TaxID=1508420 RepID=UPI000597C941|nr:DMT family transporter [Thermotoga profunda]